MKNNTGTFGPYFLFLCAFFMMVFSVLSALGWLAIGGSLALLILTAFLNPDFRKPEDPNNPVSTWLILAFCIFGASWVYTLTLQNGNTHPGINAALALCRPPRWGGYLLSILPMPIILKPSPGRN